MMGLIFSTIAGIRRRSLALWRDSDGVVVVMLVAMLPALVAFAALAIDMSYAYWLRTQLQHAASAAALAGVQGIVDGDPDNGMAPDGVADNDAYRVAAIRYAYKNMTENRFGRVISSSCGIYDSAADTVGGSAECADIKVGNWNPDAEVFTAWDDAGFELATMSLDAVRVWTRKAQSNGNPFDLFFGPALGFTETDISTVAVAWNEGGGDDYDCFQNGMIAGNLLEMQGLNSVGDYYCMYGRNGVSVQSDNYFDPTTKVGLGVALDAGDPYGLLQQQGNTGLCVDPQNPSCVVEDGLTGIEPERIEEFTIWLAAYMAAIDGGNINQIEESWPEPVETIYSPSLVDGITELPPPPDPPDSYGECTVDKNGTIETVDAALEQNTIFIVDGTASITSGATVCNVVIIADKIDIASGVTLRNVTLIANDSSDVFNANISLGGDFDIDNVVVAAMNRVQFASWGEMGGDACNETGTTVEVYAGENVYIASNTTISNAAILAEGDVDMGSNNAINLTGNGATIQARNDIYVASDGIFGACPDQDAGPSTGPAAGLKLRITM